MSQLSEWDVTLAVSGAISVKRPLSLDVEKGSRNPRRNPFWTTVKLSNCPYGIRAEVIVRASTSESANDAAVHFFGQMLDVLGLHLNTPLYLNLFGPEFRPVNSHVKRRVEEDKWMQSFELAREYALTRSTFGRSLSWYRKGLISEDPFDRLIAYWSALERISTPYASKTPKAQKGAVNKICDCFDQLWGDVSHWKVIPNEASKVNQFYDFRNGIAHGFMDVDIEQIREIGSKLPVFHNLTHAFLSDWERMALDLHQMHAVSSVA